MTDIAEVIVTVGEILAVFGVVPAAIIAPVGKLVWLLFENKKEKKDGNRQEREERDERTEEYET